jgi:4-hydroxy-3-polyprenylbenzoate decarboxylase
MREPAPKRLIVGITGATGVIYGVRALELLRQAGVESHVIMSSWAVRTLQHETTYSVDDVKCLANYWYNPNDMGAAISSGSFLTEGMLVVPCTVRTLAAIATGNGDHLVHRAADVILKERRKLVLAVREAPFNQMHLENMLKLAQMGVVVSSPVPAFYNHPRSIEEIIDHTVMRLLDQFGLHIEVMPRWTGQMAVGGPDTVTKTKARTPAPDPASSKRSAQ